ncbi:MAG: LEPR-XLL domain-containing protein, partial [Planctomycetes bacterium]|nr:LEPR-XLL domain-containing protein [Planctomycetota bacterium]
MARRKQSLKDKFLRRSARGPFSPRVARSSRLPLHLEQLEPRMLMDGAGFIHTDPEPDPDSVVGVAVIAAQDDYVKVRSGTQQLRIDVLGNDPLPDGSDNLHIKSVSDTLRGATVTISDDGTRIIYTAPEGGVTFDSFYYIVEDSEGNLGKANVQVGSKANRRSPVIPPTQGARSDHFYFIEDGPERKLNVLRNDGPFSNGEIIEVVANGSPHGTMRIAADGKSLFYQPDVGFSGNDYYQYTVRNESGETSTASVGVRVNKPFAAKRFESYFDIDGGPHVLKIIAHGIQYQPTPETPRLINITGADYSGELTISEDGQTVFFEPKEDFLGTARFTYTVRYGPAEYQTTTGTGQIHVQNTFLAVDNWFTVDPDSSGNQLDVLANDPILPRGRRVHGQWPSSAYVTLQIVGVGAGNQGGEIVIEEGKALETEKEVVEGMQFDKGFLSPYFMTDPGSLECELTDPAILIHEKKISNLR